MSKKLIIALAFATSVAMNVHAEFDKERFERDTQAYQENIKNAEAISILLSSFNTDNGVREAFELLAMNDISRWKTMLSYLKKADEYAEKIPIFTYFNSCKASVVDANLMWAQAPKGEAIFEWDDPSSKRLERFQRAKNSFVEKYMQCKKLVANAPNKKDYQEVLVPLGN